jgi:integration host factor subunit alpha
MKSGGGRTVNKSQLVERVRDTTGLSWPESAEIFESVLEVLKNTLEAGETVKITGFGTFQVRAKAARSARNPLTNTTIVIPKRRVLSFKPSAILRQSLNGGKDPA